MLARLGRDAVLDLFEGADGWDIVEQALAMRKGLIFVTATSATGSWLAHMSPRVAFRSTRSRAG
jgi:hypothetical protein